MLEVYQLKNMLQTAAEMGATIALKKAGLKAKDEISQREAYRRFGESKVKVWRTRGLIKRVKEGNRNAKATYSLIELEAINMAERSSL
mgnify:CR=1 FL=1